MVTNTDLKKAIINISYANRLSHLGSCLTMVDLLAQVYKHRSADDPVILSAGHSGLALYVVIEAHKGPKAESLFDIHGVHPNRDVRSDKPVIWASSGSLGHGIGIALGMALSKQYQTIYCLTTDGELSEGSCWEALRVISEQKIDNIKLLVNYNGWGAYKAIDAVPLIARFQAHGWGVYKATSDKEIDEGLAVYIKDTPIVTFVETHVEQLPFLRGLQAHYTTMNQEDYESAMEILR